MVRKKNVAFTGVRVSDADPDAPSFQRGIEDTVGDVAIVYDVLTGEHGETNVINHSGAPFGAPLNLPLLNTPIFANLTYAGSQSSVRGPTALVAVPVFIAPGTDQVGVQIHLLLMNRGFAWSVVLYDGDMTLIERKELVPHEDLGAASFIVFYGTTSGKRIITVEVDTTDLPGDASLGDLFSVQIARFPFDSRQSSPFTPNATFGVTVPGAAEGVFHRNFDEALFFQDSPIDGAILAGLNRNLNGLHEFLTGNPPMSQPYTHEDHDGGGSPDGIDPARSRFHAHTRSLYASEPLAAIPLWAEIFGAIKLNGEGVVQENNTPSFGLNYYAPWTTVTAKTVVRRTSIRMPDIPSAQFANIKASVLLAGSGTLAQWTVYVNINGTERSANPTACTGNTAFSRVDLSDFTIAPDLENLVQISFQKTVGGAPSPADLCLVGATIYFEP